MNYDKETHNMTGIKNKKPVSSNKKTDDFLDDDLENIKKIKEKVAKWPKWKKMNIKLAFTENYQKKPEKF